MAGFHCIHLRGERAVIRLRNPTEDKRAFRRMLTSADRGKLGLSVKMADSLACLRGLVTGEIANICNSL